MSETAVSPPGRAAGWRERLDRIVVTMREISSQTDPQEMVRRYGARTEGIVHRDRLVTLSRRGHEHPEFRVTRDSQWKDPINPWSQRDRLPVLRGGLLAELIYGDEPRVIDDVQSAPDDPGAPYLAGQRSVLAVPLYDRGVALNMVLMMRKEPAAFSPEDLPEQVWLSNLFGRATHSLVLSDELRRAYQAADDELKVVADIQRSLLPAALPEVPGLDLAAHYETSRHAGGDYYDFFPVGDDRWGVLIADVSGHGTPAAVLMAITRTLARMDPEPPACPADLLTRLNRRLAELYTMQNGTFVTAFYGVYDAADRSLCYASAGHNPPRLKRCADGTLITLSGTAGLPLGVDRDTAYGRATQRLVPGDQIVFYTDGITEAFSPAGELFGTERLDRVLSNCGVTARGLVDEVLAAVRTFAAGRPADDDRTLLVAKVR